MFVGPVKRFDQRDDMFRRSNYDPIVMKWKKQFTDRDGSPNKLGYSHEFFPLTDAAWYIEDHFAMGNVGSNKPGLYAWESYDKNTINSPKSTLGPEELTRKVKNAAAFFGASLVGICRLNKLWIYSHVVDDLTGERQELSIPEEFQYAIAIAIEMDYNHVQTSPSAASSAATGLGYSKMAFTVGLVAHFIRCMGYAAIPSGNDTALSIPIAVEAGLGELGRNGLLITEKYGPRVRLCKVFTDMPLIPDSPKYFGAERFCNLCKKCARDCPSQAISNEGKCSEAITASNNSGILKWMINPEQCYRFWGANRTDCSNCIRVCPFNQRPGWHHDLVRYFIKHVPWSNAFFLWFHGLLNYDNQVSPTDL